MRTLSLLVAASVGLTSANLWAQQPAAPSATAMEGGKLSAQTVRDAVNETARIVAENYILLDRRDQIAAELRARANAGNYDRLGDWRRVAIQLTDDLKTISGDLHFDISFDPETIASWSADNEEEPLEDYRAAVAQQWRARRQGLHSVEVLPGNIGLIRLDYVPPPSDLARGQWNAAMAQIADADALILDLRVNRGGSPEGVAMLLGSLIGGGIHYATIERSDGSATPMTSATPEGPVFAKRPIFILVSHYTASAGEALAYHLQALGAATLVGEQTAGGAHPTDLLSINENLILRIPRERTVSAITGKNWEGSGVAPDTPESFQRTLPRSELLAVEAVEKANPVEAFANSRDWLRTIADGKLAPWSPDEAQLARYAAVYPGAGTFAVREGRLVLLDDAGDVELEPVAEGIFRNRDRDEILYAFDLAGDGPPKTVMVAYSDGRALLYELQE